MQNHHAFIAGVAVALAAMWIIKRPRNVSGGMAARQSPAMQTGMYVPPYDVESVTKLQ